LLRVSSAWIPFCIHRQYLSLENVMAKLPGSLHPKKTLFRGREQFQHVNANLVSNHDAPITIGRPISGPFYFAAG
jgi:hypothetical protein